MFVIVGGTGDVSEYVHVHPCTNALGIDKVTLCATLILVRDDDCETMATDMSRVGMTTFASSRIGSRPDPARRSATLFLCSQRCAELRLVMLEPLSVRTVSGCAPTISGDCL